MNPDDKNLERSFDDFAALYCERQVQTPAGLKEVLLRQKAVYEPDGWLLLEAQLMDSSWFGSRCILPYGPNNTHHEVPDHPISPRGLASDTSVVIAILPAAALSHAP